MEKIATIALSLGSNLGDRKLNIDLAIDLLKEYITVERISSYYETPPLGFDSTDFFLNVCLIAKSNVSPFELLSFTQLVEKKIGRNKKSSDGVYESREIDIDIIFYDDKVINETNFILPHKHFKDRRFVLEPLSEILSDWIDPTSKKTIRELCLLCEDNSKIIKI
jgi:2-amino-4-hydroxy-6-hydroxymethyldihydropteridine diphosphokinase